jgi:hypothetical protein
MKTIITKTENNRIVKYLELADDDAQAALDNLLENYPSAFIYNGAYRPDLWVDGNVITVVPIVEPITVPKTVTMRQARLALLGAGLLNSVNTAINGLTSPQKEAAQIEWEYSQEVHRDKELVGMLAPILGLSDAQIDALFIAAVAL